MRKEYRYILTIMTALILVACGEYQAVLKSKDPDYKYQKALEYFNMKKYVRSQMLLEDIASYYKGTERSEDVLIYLSRSYMGQKDYTSAADYYQAYIRNYPKGKYITEARFQVGHCYYLEAPDPKLDQQLTKKAIQFFTEFVEYYPDSPYSRQAYDEMNEMYNKLAYKEYLNAKLYYNLGTYLGNNYLSAEIVARNALRDYPSNSYMEELSWLILLSKYQQAVYSVDAKKGERTRNTIDEYYNFVTEFPNSKHRREAERILKQMQRGATSDYN